MAKTLLKRNVGLEILEGLRELKHGDVGRVINVPSVSVIRERTGLSQAKFACSAWSLRTHFAGMGTRTPRAIGCGANAPNGRGEEPPGSA